MGRPGSLGLTVKAFALDENLGKQYLHALDVFAPGTVVVTDTEGTQVTVEFPAVADGGCYPHRWELLIKSVDTGTTVALADLVGLH